MKKFWSVAVLAALAALTLGTSEGVAQQQMKFGYINSQQILAEAPGAAAAQEAFEADMQQYRSEVAALEQELERLRSEYERQQATLSAEARQQRQQQIQEKFVAYQQRLAELERTAQRRQAELVSPIMERISQVIEDIREQGNYSMIFDTAAGALITADPSLDLTQQVLGRLQSE